MRRSPVILTSALVAIVAAVLGVLAWRADSSSSGAPATTVTATAPAGATSPSTSLAPSPASTSVAPPEPLPTSTSPTAATSASPTTSPAPPPATAAPPPSSAPAAVVVDGPASSCPSSEHGAIVDRDAQQAWLCGDGAIVAAMPITSAWSMPDPGTYPVYAKDLDATSNFGGHFSRMTHFVAFTYGKRTGARIAFHSVPTLNDGAFVQPLDSVGEASRRGDSSGCIRVLPDDAERIWDWLSVGDEVHVVS